MKNKELKVLLDTFPDDMEVLLDRNGSVYTECAKPVKKFMGSKQKGCIVLYSQIKIG